ncbi:hypothetical protein AcV5_010030 [Taiwanofungus camphoratus]|nr:hypothetical protein AcV5_010030 [Antrodia cinnamomea]
MTVCFQSQLTYDILVLVFEHFKSDYHTLYHGALVCHAFNRAASKWLYMQVTFSPAQTRTLNLSRKNEFSEGKFLAARLPHNATRVLGLEISGYLSSRPHSLNSFSSSLRDAIQLWPNITTVVFAPKHYYEDLFTTVLQHLPTCAFLRDLTVNASCTDEIRAPILTRIEGLEKLTIYNPSRAVLELLPEWLRRLSGTLLGFHLRDNCGSITPGVLRSFIPHIQKIRSFALGLSYSLTDDDVFSCFNQLHGLRSLEFRYYLQLRPPSILPRLSNLLSLTVRYSPIDRTEYAARFCKWVRHVVAYAPLVELSLVCEEESRGASVNFDGLAAHLAHKHAETLRVLNMGAALVGRDALATLCAKCVRLEEIAVAISANVLNELPELFASLHQLHTVCIQTRNVRRGVLMDSQWTQSFICRGPRRLRRLAVDGVRWEGQWVSNVEGEVVFKVGELFPPRVPPWEQGSQDVP